MEQLTKRLTDTATILSNTPRMIDLASERDLSMLAALVKGYVDCEGVKRAWDAVAAYLEGIALVALATEGCATITKDAVCTRRVGVLEDALRYVRSGEASKGGKDLHGERASDYALLRDALWFATHGEPEVPRLKLSGGERKPCSMRRAFELAMVEADAKAKDKANAEDAARVEAERDKRPADMTPAERKRKLAELEAAHAALLPSIREVKRKGAPRLRELRRLVKADAAARKSKPKRNPTPIDSKHKAVRAKAKRAHKATRKAA